MKIPFLGIQIKINLSTFKTSVIALIGKFKIKIK